MSCGGSWGRFCVSWRSKKGVRFVEGQLRPDHVHIVMRIPPKYAVSAVIGFIKGKSAIAIARLQGKERNFAGEAVLGAGLCGVDGRL